MAHSRSGNDISLFECMRGVHGSSGCDTGSSPCAHVGRNPGIIVGNAQPELLDWLVAQPQDGRLQLTDAPFANGILEGLAHHGLH